MRYFCIFFVVLGICIPAAAEDVSANETAKDTVSQTVTNSGVVLGGGIKADAVFMNFLKKGAGNAVSTFAPGGGLGGFMTVDFNERIGLRPEVNLNFKQTIFGWDDNSGRMRTFGIEVPIYVVVNWDAFENHHLYFGIGPYTEFCCSAHWTIGSRSVNLLEINEQGEPMIQDSQSGFGAIFGYEFGCGIGVNLTYKLCCFNILQPNTSQGVSLFPQSASIGLSYKFRKRV